MNLLRALATLVVSITCVAQVSAVPLASYTSAAIGNNDGPWSLGFQFTTGATQSLVTALGAFDFGGDGFAQSHEVGIWSLGGTLLASTTVNSSDVFEAVGSAGDGFRYAAISPLVLDANTSYVVAAANFGVGDAFSFDASNGTMLPGFTYNLARYLQTSALEFPTDFSSSPFGYFGANLQIGPADAPELDGARASLPLAFTAFALLAASGARRKSDEAKYRGQRKLG